MLVDTFGASISVRRHFYSTTTTDPTNKFVSILYQDVYVSLFPSFTSQHLHVELIS